MRGGKSLFDGFFELDQIVHGSLWGVAARLVAKSSRAAGSVGTSWHFELAMVDGERRHRCGHGRRKNTCAFH
jgi:hypothetical protein